MPATRCQETQRIDPGCRVTAANLWTSDHTPRWETTTEVPTALPPRICGRLTTPHRGKRPQKACRGAA